MIPLTRLRHGETFFLNPDLFERVDTHVDTVIKLIDGTEYVVVEPAEEIIRRIADFRARIIALAGVLQAGFCQPDEDDPEHATAHHGGPLAELGVVPPVVDADVAADEQSHEPAPAEPVGAMEDPA